MRSQRDLRGLVLGVRTRHGHLIAPSWRVIGMRCGVDRVNYSGRGRYRKTIEAGFVYLENLHTGWREDVPHRVIAGGLSDGTLAIVDEVTMGDELKDRRVSAVVKRVIGLAAALLVCLVVTPLQAQTLGLLPARQRFEQGTARGIVTAPRVTWTWGESARRYLGGDLSMMEALEVVDAGHAGGTTTPITPICDTPTLTCHWTLSAAAQARLALPGRHIIQAGFRQDPDHRWSFLTQDGAIVVITPTPVQAPTHIRVPR